MREALVETSKLTNRNAIAQFNATIEAEAPHDLISVFKGLFQFYISLDIYPYTFTGAISISGQQQLPLAPKQLLLRGCVLRNTDWCIGVAIYVGKQTKLMLNSMYFIYYPFSIYLSHN